MNLIELKLKNFFEKNLFVNLRFLPFNCCFIWHITTQFLFSKFAKNNKPVWRIYLFFVDLENRKLFLQIFFNLTIQPEGRAKSNKQLEWII